MRLSRERCSYKNCGIKKKDSRLRFFHFPITVGEHRDAWITNCAVELESHLLTPKQLAAFSVCQCHFSERSFRDILHTKIYKEAIPTLDNTSLNILPGPAEPDECVANGITVDCITEVVPVPHVEVSTSQIKKKPRKSKKLAKSSRLVTDNDGNFQNATGEVIIINFSPTFPSGDASSSQPHNDHDYFGIVNDNESGAKILEEELLVPGSPPKTISGLKRRNKELVSENKQLKKRLLVLEKKCLQQESDLKTANSKLEKKTFGLRSILGDDKLARFYTGFASYEFLCEFLDFVVEGYKQNYVPSTKNTGRPQSLDNRDQIFLVLCRLRLGYREDDLAHRFDVGKATVSKVWNIWAPFLLAYLGSVPSWPGHKRVRYLFPTQLKETIEKLQLFRSPARKSITSRKCAG